VISFDPLFDFMHFNKLQIQDVRKAVGISPKTAAKFKKGESVSLSTVERICLHYKIPIEQVVEIKLDEEPDDQSI